MRSRSSCSCSCSVPASRSTAGRRRAAAGRARRPRRPRRRWRRSPRASSAIRGLRFEPPPRPAEVSPAQAKRDGLEDLDRSYPASRRATPTRRCSSCSGCSSRRSTCGRCRRPCSARASRATTTRARKRLRIVHGAQTTNRFLEEITLAHELTHALEDQRFGLDLEDTSGSDDAALARLALVEGSATAVMLDLRRAPLLRRADPRRAVREPRPGHRRPAAVRGGAAAVPLPHRPALRRSGCTRPATTAGRWSTRPSASARPPPPSRSCTRRSTSRSSSLTACVSTLGRVLGEGWRRASWPGPGASGRRASCSPTRARPRAGEATATSSGSSPSDGCQAPCRAARRARHALALGHAPRRPRVRDRTARVAARGSRGPARSPHAARRSRSPSPRTPGSHSAWPRASLPAGAGSSAVRAADS